LGSAAFCITLRAQLAEDRYGSRAKIMEPQEIEELIRAGFADAEVQVQSDDNTHYGALVVASEFEGKRPLARHQLIYKTLGSLMGNEIHALSINALTPDEWRARQSKD